MMYKKLKLSKKCFILGVGNDWSKYKYVLISIVYIVWIRILVVWMLIYNMNYC